MRRRRRYLLSNKRIINFLLLEIKLYPSTITSTDFTREILLLLFACLLLENRNKKNIFLFGCARECAEDEVRRK